MTLSGRLPWLTLHSTWISRCKLLSPLEYLLLSTTCRPGGCWRGTAESAQGFVDSHDETASDLFRGSHLKIWLPGSVQDTARQRCMLHLDGHILACLLVPPTFDHRKACSQAVYSLLSCLSSTTKHRWGPPV